MARNNDPKKFLTASENEQLKSAISEAEKSTSAELKVIIARHAWMGIKKKAALLFRKHGLHKTAERNCVLVLLVTTEHQFLIYGDEGIHEKVGQHFWDDVRDEMNKSFAEDKMGEGLAVGVKLIGEKLAEHFPHKEDDKNEISNEVANEE